jgi:rhodanese-related sulfurtransferase
MEDSSMKKLAFVLMAVAAVAVFASGLDAQCCGHKKAPKNVAACGGDGAAVAQKANSGGMITTGALVALIQAGAPITIVDARNHPGEMIKGAKTLSDGCMSCSKTLAKMVGSKDRLVVTYCAGPKCPASKKMAAKLRAAGYTNVIEYPEGYAGWKHAKASCGKSCGSSCGESSAVCPASGATAKSGSCSSCPSAKAAVAKAPVSRINSAGLKALLDAKVPVTVVDARYGKFDDGTRIPGALALKCKDCVGKPEAMQNFIKSKNQLIVTYCAAKQCPLSSMLAKKLRAAGYTNVIEYKGGLADWKKSGFKTVSKEASCCGTCSDKAGCSDKSGCGTTTKKKGCCGGCGGGCGGK